MHSRGLIIFALFLLAIFVTDDALAQRRRSKFKRRASKNRNISSYRGGSVGGKFRSYQYVAFGVNAMNYYGDLAPVNRAGSSDISFTRPGIGVTYGYRLHPMFAVRATLNYGRLKGDDITSDPNDSENLGRYLRNLSFRNDIKELSAGVNIYVLPDYNGPNFRHPFNFYVFVGAAIIHHEPKGKVPDVDYQLGDGSAPPSAGEWVKLRPLGTEGQNLDIDGVAEPYKSIEFAIPIMLGATMRLPGAFNASIEFGPRILFTDYIDDVSTNYIGLDLFDDPLARVMSDRSAEAVGVWNGDQRNISPSSLNFNGQSYFSGGIRDAVDVQEGRGNPDGNDLYFVTQIKVTYLLSKAKGKRKPAKFR